jgi:hypothetical protein
MCTNSTKAIYCLSTHGPTFGGGHDIHISSGSNANQTSYCNFGSSFKTAGYEYCTAKAQSILAGSFYFQTIEIEVFSITE